MHGLAFVSDTRIVSPGVRLVSGVLEECRSPPQVHLSGHEIDAEGTGRLAGVLGECTALAHVKQTQAAPCGSGTATRELRRTRGRMRSAKHRRQEEDRERP